MGINTKLHQREFCENYVFSFNYTNGSNINTHFETKKKTHKYLIFMDPFCENKNNNPQLCTRYRQDPTGSNVTMTYEENNLYSAFYSKR